MFNKELFGERVRYFRQKRGYTLDKVCGLIGIEPSSLSSIELGNTTPKVNTFVNIAKALDVPCTALINNQGEDEILDQQILSKVEKIDDNGLELLICISKKL